MRDVNADNIGQVLNKSSAATQLLLRDLEHLVANSKPLAAALSLLATTHSAAELVRGWAADELKKWKLKDPLGVLLAMEAVAKNSANTQPPDTDKMIVNLNQLVGFLVSEHSQVGKVDENGDSEGGDAGADSGNAGTGR